MKSLEWTQRTANSLRFHRKQVARKLHHDASTESDRRRVLSPDANSMLRKNERREGGQGQKEGRGKKEKEEIKKEEGR